MGKKCIPGVICVENVTIILLVVIGSMVFYLYYLHLTKNAATRVSSNSTLYPVMQQPATAIIMPPPINSSDPRIELSNPYMPPLKTDTAMFGLRQVRSEVRTKDLEDYPEMVYHRRIMPSFTVATRPTVGIPVNIPTSTANTAYSQSGILTKQGNSGEQMILPLMGRNLYNGRDKWQYYTMTNGAGSINTKLPISVNGKSGTSEYGCDSISTGDTVYVEGYNDTFRATVYENALMQYLPI
jgi:hypothetical protein